MFVKTCPVNANPGPGPDPDHDHDRKVQNDAPNEFLISEKSDAHLGAKVLEGEGVLLVGARVLLCQWWTGLVLKHKLEFFLGWHHLIKILTF